MKTKKRKALRVVLLVVLAVIVLMTGGFYIYTLDYYRADLSTFDESAVTAMVVAEPDSTPKDLLIFKASPEKDQKTGLIFYPGGKVAFNAYIPLMTKLSDEGITCVLVKMPFNLAVFDPNAADRVYGQLPDIRHWYIGGHSLGGAMASSYAGKAGDQLSGLVLLAAYPVNDASLPTLVLYGTEDHVLDRSKITGVDSTTITGGNHAYFGNYGEQKGDGTATITRDEQQMLTVKAIIEFINSNNV
jgi:dienelactone hydrolase